MKHGYSNRHPDQLAAEQATMKAGFERRIAFFIKAKNGYAVTRSMTDSFTDMNTHGKGKK